MILELQKKKVFMKEIWNLFIPFFFPNLFFKKYILFFCFLEKEMPEGRCLLVTDCAPQLYVSISMCFAFSFWVHEGFVLPDLSSCIFECQHEKEIPYFKYTKYFMSKKKEKRQRALSSLGGLSVGNLPFRPGSVPDRKKYT